MTNLSDKDREILACAYFQADATLAKIARDSNHKEHVVRYCLDNLIERGIIKRHAVINPYPLGFTEYYIMFAVKAQNDESKKRALETLRQAQEVSWLGEMGGEFQYGADMYARGPEQVAHFLEKISGEIGGVLIEKKLSVVLSLTIFPPQYLSKAAAEGKSIGYKIGAPLVEIDEIDHRILSALMSCSYSNDAQLARSLKLPSSTLEYRIASLKEKNVLIGLCYHVADDHLLGLSSFLVLAHVNDNSAATKQKLFEYCKAHPKVSYLAEALGHADYEIGVKCERPQDISDFVQDLSTRFAKQISRCIYYPELRSFKQEYYPFRSFQGTR